MKIICIGNTGELIPKIYLTPGISDNKEQKFQLTVGKEYIVYALYQWQGTSWYYICDDNYIYYPQKNPAPLFQISDNNLSSYWKIELAPNGLLTIAFEQWFSYPNFYDRLTDMEKEAVSIFQKFKKLIDAE